MWIAWPFGRHQIIFWLGEINWSWRYEKKASNKAFLVKAQTHELRKKIRLFHLVACCSDKHLVCFGRFCWLDRPPLLRTKLGLTIFGPASYVEEDFSLFLWTWILQVRWIFASLLTFRCFIDLGSKYARKNDKKIYLLPILWACTRLIWVCRPCLRASFGRHKVRFFRKLRIEDWAFSVGLRPRPLEEVEPWNRTFSH